MPPDLSVSELNEYRLWSEPSISSMALLVVADYVPGEGESHYGSPHRFPVATYTFNARTHRYQLRDQYLAATRYPSLDEADEIRVLEQQRPRVLARLKRGA